MTRRPASAPRPLRRALLAAACIALVGVGWVGYGAGNAPFAWAALWSLCAPVR